MLFALIYEAAALALNCRLSQYIGRWIDVRRPAWAWFLFQIFLLEGRENKVKPKDLQAYPCSKRDGFLLIPEVKP